MRSVKRFTDNSPASAVSVHHWFTNSFERALSDFKRWDLFSKRLGQALWDRIPMFYAFAVDIHGTVQAHYTLAAKSAHAAAEEGQRLLREHAVIEIWSDDRRRVARLVKDVRCTE